jgi:hypothetical protein
MMKLGSNLLFSFCPVKLKSNEILKYDSTIYRGGGQMTPLDGDQQQ